MVKRLLSALEYPQCEAVNINDENTFRKVVCWLEMNKIQKASPSTSTNLKNVGSKEWAKVFSKYREELGCPKLDSTQEELQWILGYAVQIETQNKRDIYLRHAVENLNTSNVPNVIAENPLDKLNFQSQEFTEGITALAKMLNITPHLDALITLESVKKVITARLSPQALEKPDSVIIRGTPFPYQEAGLGFDLKDPVLNKAAKVLRMLYIHDLRDLQTKANELIVGVQNVTANPKTDTKLGKVGR